MIVSTKASPTFAAGGLCVSLIPVMLIAAIPLPEGVTLPVDDLDDPQQTQPAPEKWLDLGLGPIQ